MANPTDMMKLAFRDELKKIAFTRSGRKPIGIERLMEREAESDNTPSNAFSDTKVSPEEFKADIEKVSFSLGSAGGAAATAGAGALALHLLSKANRDRKLGRAMRLQQDASGQ